MARFRDLRISTKFNLILTLSLLVLFVSAAWLNYLRQRELIVKGAVDSARLIARQIIDTREYMSSVVKNEPAENYNLVPQVVATQVAKKLTQNTKYYVRQVSLRYRNPNNRPDGYETAQLETFKNTPRETWDIITSARGRELRYMLPMKAEKSCLECHGAYEHAPRFVQVRFPRGHYSYNYQIGEVIGAVSVIVPMSSLYNEIITNLDIDLVSRGAIFLVIIILLGVLIRRTIIEPVAVVARSITRAARTGNFGERIRQRSNDEIGQLIAAFNEMMGDLERKTQQSRESEERYRNFIKMAQSAVVTFMEDGKIIISNEKAEKLLGIARQDILGENIYSFIENGAELQQQIAEFIATGIAGVIGETTHHRIKNAAGYYTDVDMALSASRTDGSIMITAILRESPK